MQPTDIAVEVADGVRLRVRHWARHGARHGAPFLLVHGLSSNARLWDEVAARLVGAGHPVFAVDLRSHGESDSPADGYDTASAAADLASVCAGLALAPAVVAGQSWGGNVAVRLAAKHRECVAALALVDGGWIDLAGDFATWPECARALRPPTIDGLHRDDVRGFMVREHPDWSATAIEATLASLRLTSRGTLRRRLPIRKHMLIVASMWDDPPWPDYPMIAAPVLLLPVVPEDPDAALRRRARVARAAVALHRARVKEYVGADHDLHAQHPAELAADLLALAKES